MLCRFFSQKEVPKKKRSSVKSKEERKKLTFFGKVCKTDTFWSGRNLSPVTLCHVGGRGQKRPDSPTQVGRTVGRSENLRGGGLGGSSYVVGIICLVEIGLTDLSKSGGSILPPPCFRRLCWAGGWAPCCQFSAHKRPWNSSWKLHGSRLPCLHF